MEEHEAVPVALTLAVPCSSFGRFKKEKIYKESNEMKSWFFRRINKIDKLLADLKC